MNLYLYLHTQIKNTTIYKHLQQDHNVCKSILACVLLLLLLRNMNEAKQYLKYLVGSEEFTVGNRFVFSYEP